MTQRNTIYQALDTHNICQYDRVVFVGHATALVEYLEDASSLIQIAPSVSHAWCLLTTIIGQQLPSQGLNVGKMYLRTEEATWISFKTSSGYSPVQSNCLGD